MMARHLALTQQTCSWLLGYTDILTTLYETLIRDDLGTLDGTEFAAGPMRAANDISSNLTAMWNRDYLTGTGGESWGIIDLDGPFGLLNRPDIGQQVFERQLYVINQRLQGLIVDSAFIHRTWPNGSHTCLAGRGEEARRLSVSYYEVGAGSANALGRSIILIGPGYDFTELQEEIGRKVSEVRRLAAAADGIIEFKRRVSAPSSLLAALREKLVPAVQDEYHFKNVAVAADYLPREGALSPYQTMHWTYDEWLKSGALNDAQVRILGSDVLLKHPVRVTGPAGSGKTLLMQLLAIRHLRDSAAKGEHVRIMYIVHNASMLVTVTDRFRQLGAEDYFSNPHQSLTITTLADYGRSVIGVTESMVIDRDAQLSKELQLEQIKKSFRESLEANTEAVASSPLFTQIAKDPSLFSVLSVLIAVEISNAIKGRGLIDDEKRYVNAEIPFSRLHRILNQAERRIVFDTFKRYHAEIFEELEMLDSDDISLTLASRLRTPLWRLQRKSEGFDFIFVDEAQLFNENERRIFPLLSNGRVPHVPLALALDEAQDLFAFSNAGLATLGIVDVENENLPSNHRSTKEIIDLSFFYIQRTTDLFSSEFPNFEQIERAMVPASHALAQPPFLIKCPSDQNSFGKFVVRQVQRLRAKNVRQVAVVCHAETYWQEMLEVLSGSQLPIHIITQRGEKISADQPLVVLTRPSLVGGQEFDAVLSVGLEQGVVPPRIIDNTALAAAVEQQVLREMYLVVSRARYQYGILLSRLSLPNALVQEACEHGLITV